MTNTLPKKTSGLRALELTNLFAKRSVVAFFSASVLILISAIFIKTSLVSQNQMLEVASITHDQRLIANELSERVIYLLNIGPENASNRFIKSVQQDIQKKVKLLNKNHENLQDSFNKNSIIKYWPFSLFYTSDKSLLIEEIGKDIKIMSADIEPLVLVKPDVIRTGFDFWNPSFLSLVKNGEHSLRIAELNDRVRGSASKQSEMLSTLHSYLLFLVCSGIWLIWLFVLRPLPKRLETVFSVYLKSQKKLEYQASHDALTGLYNRQSFTTFIKEITKQDSPPNAAIFAIDLDDFKIINDTAGHKAGDRVLESVSIQMMKDKLEGEKHFRTGGDEFIIIIENFESWNRLNSRARSICKACSTPINVDGRKIYPKISMGIAYQNGQFNTMEELLSAADLALYHVKDGGGDNFSEYSQVENRSIARLLSKEKELSDAIRKKELVVYYQPIIRASDNKIIGLEVLTRWNHPLEGILLPSNWLTTATRLGLLTEISTHALVQVESDIQQWHSLGINPVQISINATENLLTSGEMLKQLSLSQGSVEKEKRFAIGIEIPESIILDRNHDRIIEQLIAMRKQGFKVLLDDFGTGYATLSHLVTLPFDTLKIDKQFANNLMVSSESQVIIKTMIGMTGDLNKDLICEGVEDYPTLSKLMDMGCKYVQGHYYSKALTFERTTELLKKQYIDERVAA